MPENHLIDALIAPNNLTGYFLAATQELNRTYFEKALIYVCKHDSDGALGLIINRPSVTPSAELLNSNGIFEIPLFKTHGTFIYFGGPVAQESLHMLHHTQFGISENVSNEINQISYSSSPTKILENWQKGHIKMDKAFFYVGYSGWLSGQLENELQGNSWLAGVATPELVFNTPPEKRLEMAITSLGVSSECFFGFSGQA